MMCLTKKRDKSIKGRMVCNGAPTREWLGREESASPAAAQESMMLLAVVDTQTMLEHNDGDDCIMMKIEGVLADTLLADNPDLHGGCVACENGKKVLHVVIL